MAAITLTYSLSDRTAASLAVVGSRWIDRETKSRFRIVHVNGFIVRSKHYAGPVPPKGELRTDDMASWISNVEAGNWPVLVTRRPRLAG